MPIRGWNREANAEGMQPLIFSRNNCSARSMSVERTFNGCFNSRPEPKLQGCSIDSGNGFPMIS